MTTNVLDIVETHRDYKIDETIKKIEDTSYREAPVKSLEFMHWANEATLVFGGKEKGDEDTAYYFINCYRVNTERCSESPEDCINDDVTSGQTPYVMKDVKLKEFIYFEMEYLKAEMNYLQFEINMGSIKLMIVCEEFEIFNDYKYDIIQVPDYHTP